MKKLSFYSFMALVIMCTSSGCHKDVYRGNVMFWFPVNHGTGTVKIDGAIGTISGYVTGGVPDCFNGVSATFTLPEGTYGYTVTSTDGNSWSGSAQVLYNQCELYQLN